MRDATKLLLVKSEYKLVVVMLEELAVMTDIRRVTLSSVEEVQERTIASEETPDNALVMAVSAAAELGASWRRRPLG